ncbi:MAG: ankyrin repeat domain-containing protein, partial [Treponema sp.]|nr:ankyrin repeat domain-containing protein [Treponema sp.]
SGNPFTGDALSIHVAKDNRQIVQTYIDAGMSLNERTEAGVPMLNVAIRAEQVDEVKWMLEQDIDLNAVSNDRGYSALMDCVWKKNLELTKILVEKKVNLDFVSSDNQSALTLAVGAGNAEMVKVLSDAGASPDKFDALGMSAWTYAKLFKRQDLLAIMEKNHHGQ